MGGAPAHQRDLRERDSLHRARQVAHDFKNAVNAIQGWATLLDESLDPDHAAREALAGVQRSSAHARDLALAVLAEDAAAQADEQGEPLAEQVAAAEPLARSLVGDEVELQLRLRDRDSRVPLSSLDVRRVLQNLLGNATQALDTQALDDGEAAPELAIRVDSTDLPDGRPAVLLSVEDNGSGMDELTARRALQRGFSTNDDGARHGLGLPIVQDLVRRAGGLVALDSSPGQGTRVELILPTVGANGDGKQAR